MNTDGNSKASVVGLPRKNVLTGTAGHYIIGIGASAGGLEAIHELFDNMPPDTSFSFVIIQHLSPDYKSLMAELLSKHTQMKVTEVEDGMLLMPNCVYVIPNKKHITVKAKRLRLTEKNVPTVPNNAIDVFFHSLAQDQASCAIAIILSGTGSDGTRGIESVKKAGGMVIVQDPATAKFDGMPNSAINSGYADFVLPPELMPEEIFNYIRHGALEKSFSALTTEEEDRIVNEILELVRQITIHDFSAYKRHTILRRIMRRMAGHQYNRLDRYLDHLRDNPIEVELLSKEFLIGVTKFFRDGEAFEILEKKIIPEIIDAKAPNDQLKFWVSACSTGEEAYSMAILVSEHLVKTGKELNVKIFASDVDRDAVELASKGYYGKQIEKDVSPERLEAYFLRQGAGYVVSQHLRKMVIFAQHNIIKDPPYSKMDLVSCRNMLIYMTPGLQKKILSILHFSLNTNGYLFLGTSENPGELAPALVEVSKKWKLYRNVHSSRQQMADVYAPPKYAMPTRNPAAAPTPARPTRQSLNGKIYDIFSEVVSEEFGYAGVFVNENHEVIHAVGNYDHYLRLPEKRLNFSLLKMVPDELAVALGVALRKAAKTNAKVSANRVRVPYRGRTRIIKVVVKPYLGTADATQRFLFVLLGEEKSSGKALPDTEVSFTPLASSELVDDLERELKETKENLHSAVEELETANEELQSSNEELISSNEELQSTNEELQSLNEELHTVNAEHQLKIRELIELNDDLNNYFRSTDIGQIVIDKNLIIRKYTPSVLRLINLIEADIGRPISHFSFNIRYEKLVDDIRYVIRTGQPREAEIQEADGNYYMLRVLPYIRLDHSLDGAVVTFVNITPLKQLNQLLDGVLNGSMSGIMAFRNVRDKHGKVVDFQWLLVNEAAARMVGRTKEELLNRRLLELMPGNVREGLFEKYVKVVETGKPLHLEHYYDGEGVKGWFETVAVCMDEGIAVTFNDISEKRQNQEKIIRAYQDLKRAEENLRRLNNELEARVAERTAALSVSEERFRLLSLATNDAVWDWNLVSNLLWWNEGYKVMFGQQPEDTEMGIDSWAGRLHPDDRERVMANLHHVINTGASQWADEFRFRRVDGDYAYVFGRGYVLHNEYGIPSRMLGSLVDLTNLKQVQEELQQTNENLVRINNDLDNFVYTASHDLKAPIINLEGLVKKLAREVQPDQGRTGFIMELIMGTIDTFKKTIQTLTDISRIQKNVSDDETDVDLNELLTDIQTSVRDMIESNEATVKTDFQEAHLIHFSRKNLHSVVHNLLTNAIKYRSPDRKPVVRISTEDSGDFVVLCVKDNGLGISPEQQKKLFTMFKRFHDHVEGSGVGLYIVKRIVENAGGRIEVESTVGEGSEFTVYFPKNN
jgi:two-component system CheB/CheR fusion protein